MTKPVKTSKQIKAKPLFREGLFDVRSVSEETRSVELAFSSEEPVDRWFGKEVLDHGKGSIRLGRLQNSGPVLMDHNHRDQVGVVEAVTIEGDRKGRATVRFGKGARADEVFADVVDGIRSKVSVGYRIHRLVLEEESDEGDTYRATDWEPYEISIVSVPADDGVGVGRSDEDVTENPCVIELKETKAMPEELIPGAPAPKPAPTVDIAGERKEAATQERTRTQKILGLARESNQQDLANKFIEQGRSAEDFEDVLNVIASQAPPTRDQEIKPIDIGLNQRENDDYSIVRAMRQVAFGGRGGIEQEISDQIAKQLGRGTDGIFVPTSLQMRAPMTAGGATVGATTVQTDVMPLIELLRNRMMVKRLGAQVLSGLDGDLQFPRQTGANTLYWVGENPGSDVAEGNATLDQLAMSPKTAQATTQYSRQLLAQSSIDIENFVRNDLTTINALGLDSAAINGTGASNQPTGIRNTAGVGLVALGTDGAVPDWDSIVRMETEVATDNADVGNLAYLTNAKARGKLKVTEKASGTAQFIWTDSNEVGMGMLNGYNAAVSNQVPSDLTKGTGTNLSSAVFGNWADLLIAEWGVMELLLDPYSMKKQGLVEITSIMLVDIGARHAESFSIVEDMITS